MNKVTKYLAAGSIILINLISGINRPFASYYPLYIPAGEIHPQLPDSTEQDTVDLKYPFKEDPISLQSDVGINSPLYLRNPSNISSEIVYDAETNSVEFLEGHIPPNGAEIQVVYDTDLEKKE